MKRKKARGVSVWVETLNKIQHPFMQKIYIYITHKTGLEGREEEGGKERWRGMRVRQRGREQVRRDGQKEGVGWRGRDR